MNTIRINERSLNKNTSMLREAGMIPGTLFGPDLDSLPVETSIKELKKMNKADGEIYKVKSKTGTVIVKFDEIQRDPVSNEYIHFSLLQLPKNQTSELEIPLEYKGTPKGAKKGGVLVKLMDSIVLEAKPKDFPETIEVDLSKLDIGDKFTIDMLYIPNKADMSLDSDEVVALCQPPAKEVNPETEDDGIAEHLDTHERLDDAGL